MRVIVGYQHCEPGERTACVLVADKWTGVWRPEAPLHKIWRMLRASKLETAVDLLSKYWETPAGEEQALITEWLTLRYENPCQKRPVTLEILECDILHRLEVGRVAPKSKAAASH